MDEDGTDSVATFAFLGTAGHASDLLGIIEAIERSGGPTAVVELFADGSADLSRFVNRRARYVGPIDEAKNRAGLLWIIAAGYSKSRIEIESQVAAKNLAFATLVHPSATIGTGSEIGAGSVVFAQAALSPLVRVGEHAVVSQGASIGHDTHIGAFATVMPMAAVSGDCWVGDGALIGAGATVLEKVRIGRNAVVGAGAVVLTDVAADTVVVGSPARPTNGRAE